MQLIPKLFDTDPTLISTKNESNTVTLRVAMTSSLVSLATTLPISESKINGSNNGTSFQVYVNGLYLSECYRRIQIYLASNKGAVIPVADINCACYGICVPPLAPNPAAYAQYLAWKDTQQQIKIINSLRDNATFLALTILNVVVGITGWLPIQKSPLYY